MSLPGRARSVWWCLLPVFLNIIGGVIAYYAVRKDDPKLAKNCIKIGLIIFAFYLINILIGVFGVFEAFF